MKKIYFLLFALCLFSNVNAQVVSFNDPELNSRLLSANPSNTIAKDLNGNYFKIDADNNGAIEINEALNVSYLDINSYSTYDQNGQPVFVAPISDLTGLNTFNNLQVLICSGNYYIGNGSLDVRSLTNLKTLTARHCNLSSLHINGMSNLENVEFFANDVASINLTGLSNLKKFYCHGNNFSTIDVTSLTNLEELNCYANNMTSLNVIGLNKLKLLECSYNQLSTLNLTGLTNLATLRIGNNLLSTINFSVCPLLKDIDSRNNSFTNLDFSGLSLLENLVFSYNLISTINLSPLVNLKQLECNNNSLTAINLSGLNLLNYLYCDNNILTQLDIRGLNLLNYISSKNNNISNFISDSNNQLNSLYLNNNKLQNLDLSSSTKIYSLNVNDNLLTNLNIKNGRIEGNLSFNGNPSLNYICADEDQLVDINNKITQYNYSNCHVNSYCTFHPGGDFYIVSGVNRFDADNNNCDSQDPLISNVKYKVTKGSTEGYFISNSTGSYSIDLQAGTYNVKPEIENPNYFTISPSELNFSFNQNSTPFTQDFCVTANGLHSDVEVSVLPIDRARPGFDAKYKIVYKNKGNQVESGSVNITFDDAKMNYVSSNPATSTQTVNNLSWDFANLLPFETRTIDVVFNINSPTESPAVNSGDVLNYTANITSGNTDEMPSDNTFELKQTVVNSFDPNDITCLEGTTVSTAKIGDYVHYMIHFENNGTANAQNIVVKNMVDLAKYDINSIVPTKGSHSFVTNITAGNKVEFIFENINLPFDDANNDGYVAFKMKIKSTLIAGDTFSKNANIYFDYNFPIVTNTATTTIAALSVQDFVFSNYFSVYPNPVSNVLNITAKESIEVSSINIYNTLGQLVLVIPNAQNAKTVDVSSLTSGNYFIKINSDKGTSNTKFVKN